MILEISAEIIENSVIKSPNHPLCIRHKSDAAIPVYLCPEGAPEHLWRTHFFIAVWYHIPRLIVKHFLVDLYSKYNLFVLFYVILTKIHILLHSFDAAS